MYLFSSKVVLTFVPLWELNRTVSPRSILPQYIKQAHLIELGNMGDWMSEFYVLWRFMKNIKLEWCILKSSFKF